MNEDTYTDIIQDFVELQEFYPTLYNTESNFPSVKAWIKQIKTSGFNDKMMSEMVKYILVLKEKNKLEQSAQLLLISAATENTLANYILARELFFGILFKKNETAAFGIITALAEKDYPDALCDLAYFYRYGVAVKKDIPLAKKYYYKAASLGLKRALKSYKEFN